MSNYILHNKVKHITTNTNRQCTYNITLQQVCVTIFSMLLWQMYVTNNNKTYLSLHVNSKIFLLDFNQIWVFLTDFHKSSQYQISQKSIQWEPCLGIWTGRHGTANVCISWLMWRPLKSEITALLTPKNTPCFEGCSGSTVFCLED